MNNDLWKQGLPSFMVAVEDWLLTLYELLGSDDEPQSVSWAAFESVKNEQYWKGMFFFLTKNDL